MTASEHRNQSARQYLDTTRRALSCVTGRTCWLVRGAPSLNGILSKIPKMVKRKIKDEKGIYSLNFRMCNFINKLAVSRGFARVDIDNIKKYKLRQCIPNHYITTIYDLFVYDIYSSPFVRQTHQTARITRSRSR